MQAFFLVSDLRKRLEQDTRRRQEVRINHKEFYVIFSKIRTILNSNSADKKKRLFDTLLNKVLVYYDRVEVFLNILPQPLGSNLNLDVNAKTLLKTLEKKRQN